MYFYPVQVCLLGSFQAFYVSSGGVCGYNKDHVNGISDFKVIALSIINAYYFLHFIGTMIFFCVVAIPINNISNLISANISE